MVKKDDWKTLEIPTQFETFFLERTLTKKRSCIYQRRTPL